VIEYFKKYTPSGRGNGSSVGSVIPREAELNTFVVLILNGRFTVPNPPGIVISIFGADGVVAYVDMSLIAKVLLSYVGTTSISNLRDAILFKINMPEDFEMILSFPWHRLYDFYDFY
jgi:hypothetical protein